MKALHIELHFEGKFLWTQLWTTCLTFQASLRMEAAERQWGAREPEMGSGGCGAARWLPKDKASDIQENSTKQRKGKGWDGKSMEQGWAQRKKCLRAFRVEQGVWD